MNCPRCKKSNSQEINLYFQKEKVKLLVQHCKVCDHVFAEDKDLLKAAQAHLKALCQQTLPK